MLFSAPMVRAILAGTKTQTRRVVKPQPPCGCSYSINGAQSHALCFKSETTTWVAPTPKSTDHRLQCPYGQPGERIWVRETWAAWSSFSDEADEVEGTAQDLVERGISRAHISYRADYQTHADRWRPSIFMPRWASRITLEIVSMRVERLQEISEADALAEGLYPNPKYAHAKLYTWDGIQGNSNNPIYAYQLLWESINGAGSWELNPWVWVVEFKRINVS